MQHWPGFRYWIGFLGVPHLRRSFVFLHQTPAVSASLLPTGETVGAIPDPVHL